MQMASLRPASVQAERMHLSHRPHERCNRLKHSPRVAYQSIRALARQSLASSPTLLSTRSPAFRW